MAWSSGETRPTQSFQNPKKNNKDYVRLQTEGFMQEIV